MGKTSRGYGSDPGNLHKGHNDGSKFDAVSRTHQTTKPFKSARLVAEHHADFDASDWMPPKGTTTVRVNQKLSHFWKGDVGEIEKQYSEAHGRRVALKKNPKGYREIS